MEYLIDTNIISELAKKDPDPSVAKWASSIKKCSLSVISIEEIFYGLAWRPNKRIQEWMLTFIDNYINVLDVTYSISRRAGVLRGEFQSKGIVRTQTDILIAATAIEHNLTLATRNVRDFEDCNAALLNPFS